MALWVSTRATQAVPSTCHLCGSLDASGRKIDPSLCQCQSIPPAGGETRGCTVAGACPPAAACGVAAACLLPVLFPIDIVASARSPRIIL